MSRRQERVSEMLREELSILISTELTDPRLEDALVNVTDVQVSPDLRAARVYIAHQAEPAQERQILSALQHSATFLRQALLTNLSLRFVPELHFTIDRSGQRGQQIDALLASLHQPAETPETDGSAELAAE